VLAVASIAACFVVKVHARVVIYIEEAPIVGREQVRPVLRLPNTVDVTVVFSSLDTMGVPAEPHGLSGPCHSLGQLEAVGRVLLVGDVEVLLLVGARARPDVLAVQAPVERLHKRSDLIVGVPERLVGSIFLDRVDVDSVVVRPHSQKLVTRRIPHHFVPFLGLVQRSDRFTVEISKVFNDNFTVIITDGDVVESLVEGDGS
jgi:hypothetical protein